VRVNTVSQSPTITTAGQGVEVSMLFTAMPIACRHLGNATSDDCANYCITLFSDLTRMVTMQNLFHDGGYSTMGISDTLINDCFTCQGDCHEEIKATK
jgi:enoyl-[acyl-carrier protein] reductase I